ncbi:MAG: thermonuclease family protein [Clostridiales bacterium]|nr:thermonuclease family protein [Clostridiales bacterium]
MKKLIPVLVALLLVLSCVLVACDTNKIADNTEHYDKITKSLKLKASYDGKSFSKDGIGEAKVASYTDGDTTNFVNVGTVRYYGIDTPESTSGWEKWGKAASNFVQEQLSKATLIVLQSTTGGKPKTDSVGQRLLGYVWYKTDSDKNLKLLNLELVENGFSANKCDPTDEYYKVFQKAAAFAKKIQLRLNSQLEDPLYSDEVKPLSIKDFLANPNAFKDYIGFYSIEAYLTEVVISSSGTHTFIATQIGDDGKAYTLNVYTGYNDDSGSKMKLGDLYVIIGVLKQHSGSWQLSGIEWDDVYSGEHKSKTKQANYYLTFDDTTKYSENASKNCYGKVTVTSAEYDSVKGLITFTGTANKLTTKGATGTEATFTFTVSATSASAIEVGDVLKVAGFQYEKGSGNITVFSYSK